LFCDNLMVRDSVGGVNGMELTVTVVEKRESCPGPSLLVSYSGNFHAFLWHNCFNLFLYIVAEVDDD
jgi:hypothetical protein